MHCMRRGSHLPPTPPFARGGKVGGVWSFVPPCEGGTQGGSSSASALRQRFSIQAIDERRSGAGLASTGLLADRLWQVKTSCLPEATFSIRSSSEGK